MDEQATEAVDVDELCTELAKLTARESDLAALLKEAKGRRKELSVQLAQEFMSKGKQSTKMGGKTFYLNRALLVTRAKDRTAEEACDALRAADLGDFIKEQFSVRTVTAHVKELLDQASAGVLAQDVMPASMQGVFTAAEECTVRVRRA